MNADRLRHAVLVATLVLSSFAFANGARSSALAAQDNPPDCGTSDWIEENSESHPNHVVRQANDVDLTMVELGDDAGGVVVLFISITSTVCIDPDTSIDGHQDAGQQPLRQLGTATVTVVEGSLSVTVVGLCPTPGCTTTDGSARIRLAGEATWTDIAAGAPATVEAGDTVVLSNVTVEMESGTEQTVIASSGGYTFAPGGGCPSSCWQVP